MGFFKDANGWSIATPSGSPVNGYTGSPASGDTRVIYASDSTGSDTDGTGISQGNGSRDRPYKTIAKGRSRMRPGSPDQLLLANGDRFGDQSLISGGGAQIQGASSTDRMIYSSYDRANGSFPDVPNPGTATPQPLLLVPFGTHGAGFVGPNMAIMGLDLYAYTRDPDNPAFNISDPNAQEVEGFRLTGNAQTIEDCCWRFFHNGGEIGGGGASGTAVGDSGQFQEIRRCRIVDNHNINDKVSVGIGGGGQGTHVLIEQNFVDRNGYHPTWNPEGSSLNHNLYLNANNTLETVWGPSNFWYWLELHGNIIARDGPHADCQVRCGGWLHNNLYFVNGTSGSGHGATNALANNLVENNVGFDVSGVPGRAQCIIALSGSFVDGHPGYYGLKVPGMKQIISRNNIALKPAIGLEAALFAIGGDNNAGILYLIQDNISYIFAANDYVRPGGSIVDDRFGGQGSYTLSGFNIITATPRPEWPFPNRTAGTYLDHILGGNGHTNEDFYAFCRAQRKGNWNPLLMSESTNDYIRQGFGRPMIGSAYAGGTTASTTVKVTDAAGASTSAPVTLNISAP